MQLYLGPELDNLAMAVFWEYQNGQISEEITGAFILTGWRLSEGFSFSKSILFDIQHLFQSNPVGKVRRHIQWWSQVAFVDV